MKYYDTSKFWTLFSSSKLTSSLHARLRLIFIALLLASAMFLIDVLQFKQTISAQLHRMESLDGRWTGFAELIGKDLLPNQKYPRRHAQRTVCDEVQYAEQVKDEAQQASCALEDKLGELHNDPLRQVEGSSQSFRIHLTDDAISDTRGSLEDLLEELGAIASREQRTRRWSRGRTRHGVRDYRMHKRRKGKESRIKPWKAN